MLRTLNLYFITRNVADLVKKEHFVLDSEYLQTMLVVVPLSNITDWNMKYEKLTDMIVPRSSQLIYQDNDHALVSITCFKKVVDEFKQRARENKFVVRDFAYDEEQLKSGEHFLKLSHHLYRDMVILACSLRLDES